MLVNVIEFFKNLPAKICANCKEEFSEQHDCYTNKCNKCNVYKEHRPLPFTITSKGDELDD